MRLDRANRSFFLLLGIALAPYLLLGVFGCGLLTVAVYRLVVNGPSAYLDDPLAWPALAFLVITAVGTVLGVRSLYRQARATRGLAQLVSARRLEPEDRVASLARAAGVRVHVMDAEESYSFTYGIAVPKVVVSRALVDRVDDTELRAVLTHERYHVRNFDPLKVFLARAVPRAFFFLPALGHLLRRYLTDRELAADRSAVSSCGQPALAGALLKVVGGPSTESISAAAAIGGSELLDVRISQLEEGHEPAPPAIPRPTLAVTAFGIVVMGLGIASIVALGNSGVVSSGDMALSAPLQAVGGVMCGAGWLVAGVALYRRFVGAHR
jgi:Zn-dependent protease with chaperone function